MVYHSTKPLHPPRGGFNAFWYTIFNLSQFARRDSGRLGGVEIEQVFACAAATVRSGVNEGTALSRQSAPRQASGRSGSGADHEQVACAVRTSATDVAGHAEVAAFA
jgi:hypothetical protein